jgi:hypothetical protein
MSLPLRHDAIAKAEAGVIDDRTATYVRDRAWDLRAGTIEEGDGLLVILCIGPLLDELLDYRRRAAEGIEIAADNVLQFPVKS